MKFAACKHNGTVFASTCFVSIVRRKLNENSLPKQRVQYAWYWTLFHTEEGLTDGAAQKPTLLTVEALQVQASTPTSFIQGGSFYHIFELPLFYRVEAGVHEMAMWLVLDNMSTKLYCNASHSWCAVHGLLVIFVKVAVFIYFFWNNQCVHQVAVWEWPGGWFLLE